MSFCFRIGISLSFIPSSIVKIKLVDPVSTSGSMQVSYPSEHMLVLSRHRDESIVIDHPKHGPIEVTIIEIRGDKVRLGIDAPTEVPVHREEVYEAIQRELNKDRKR